MSTRIAPWAFNVCVCGNSNATIQLDDNAMGGADIQTWNASTSQLVTARGDLNATSSAWTGLGWTIALARDTQNRYPVTGRTAVVVNTSWPGKPIAYFLKTSEDVADIPGGTDSLGRNNYEITRAYWTSIRREPTHFVLVHGENDPGVSQSAFQASLEALIDDLVADYPQLVRIVMKKVAQPAAGGTNLSGPRAAQEAVAAARDYVTLVAFDSLTDDATYHDGLHYTAAGCLAIASGIAPHLHQGIRADF